MSSAVPSPSSPSPTQQANLERWRLSGEPVAWVLKQHYYWNQKDWDELLAALRDSQYWPMFESAIGQHLEMLRAKLKQLSLRNAAAVGGKEGKEIIELYVAAKADIDQKDFGATPLYHAVQSGRTEMVEMLLAAKADPNAQATDGNRFPLVEAVERGNKDIVKLLLATGGTNVNCQDHLGKTPLYRAVEKGRTEMVEMLLAAKADPNTQAKYLNQFPLVEAVDRGDKDIVKLLLAARADVNSRDFLGKTPLYKAVEGGHWAVAKLLRAHSGRVSARQMRALLWDKLEIPAAAIFTGGVFAALTALMHWLAPAFPIRGAEILGVVSFLSLVCSLIVLDRKQEDVRTGVMVGWAVLIVGTAVVARWLSPWLPTWASAGVFAILTAPFVFLLLLLLPSPSSSTKRPNETAGKVRKAVAAEKPAKIRPPKPTKIWVAGNGFSPTEDQIGMAILGFLEKYDFLDQQTRSGVPYEGLLALGEDVKQFCEVALGVVFMFKPPGAYYLDTVLISSQLQMMVLLVWEGKDALTAKGLIPGRTVTERRKPWVCNG
jgi:hypothetical protein